MRMIGKWFLCLLQGTQMPLQWRKSETFCSLAHIPSSLLVFLWCHMAHITQLTILLYVSSVLTFATFAIGTLVLAYFALLCQPLQGSTGCYPILYLAVSLLGE